MIDHRATRRYSRALFLMAEEAGNLEAVDKDLETVTTLVDRHPEITHLVLNSTLSQAEKDDFLSKILPTETSRLVLHFITLLTRKRRFRELGPIQRHFRRLLEKKRGLQEVLAVSASPLAPKTEDRLVTILKRRLGTDIRLLKEVRPEIIGGIILRFEGTEIDASYRNRLDEIAFRLKATGSQRSE